MTHGQSETGEGQAAAKSEGRREEVRRSYKANANVCRAGTPLSHPATVIDLSTGGCLLRTLTKGDFDVDDLVDLSVQSSDLCFRARGSVRQVRENGLLVGIRLENLTTRGKVLLIEVIKELEAGFLASV